MTYQWTSDRPSALFLDHSPSRTDFAADVRAGLAANRQKVLYPKYFYDDLGSALFEAITLLPEYGLTRADARLLRDHADDLIAINQEVSVIAELGSGTGTKTRLLLDRLANPNDATYCPIDISQFALEKCELETRRATRVKVHALQDSFLPGLESAVRLRRPGTPVLVLFLGSTIGNFDPDDAEEFCRSVRQLLKPGDTLLLSTDLQKPVNRVIAAYDDPIGVTAAFNLNILVRINRELDGTFDVTRFRHLARYDHKAHRIEMHLQSLATQQVMLDGDFAVTFRQGETIWTESSYKFSPKDLVSLAKRSGFDCETQWTDREWQFAQSVFRAV
jgi:dimethylhistidine N-methyltransferase